MSNHNPPLGLLLLLGAALALFAFSRTQRGRLLTGDVVERVVSTVRGLRNNNPMNLKRTTIPWKGKIATREQAAALGLQWDPLFEQFTHASYGVRAGARDLRDDYHRDGKRTVAALIEEFSHTDQAAYFANVARAVGIPLALVDQMEFNLEAKLGELLEAIIRQELGVQPYTRDQLVTWANLA